MRKKIFPVGSKIIIKTKKGDVYNGVHAVVISLPFSPEENCGAFTGAQRIRFTPPVYTGERMVYFDALQPKYFINDNNNKN